MHSSVHMQKVKIRFKQNRVFEDESMRNIFESFLCTMGVVFRSARSHTAHQSLKNSFTGETNATTSVVKRVPLRTSALP